jgi:hypothetical protein
VSVPFVASLRVRPEIIRLRDGAADAATLRVEMPEVWDAVRVDTPLSEPVRSLKTAALDALYPGYEYQEDFILKLKGFEVLDEGATLAEAGAVNGSIFLLAHRRRRPVR